MHICVQITGHTWGQKMRLLFNCGHLKTEKSYNNRVRVVDVVLKLFTPGKRIRLFEGIR